MSILILVVLAMLLTGGPQQPALLRCEYLADPLGIDAPRPRLSWAVQDHRRGAVQTAYRILVASSADRLGGDEGDLWDTGEVRSNQTAQVEYAGKPLATGAQVFWKVRTWDRAGQPSPWSEPATWTMGVAPGSRWPAEARWIGLPGGHEPAVPAHNGFHSDFADRADAPKWVTIDLGESRQFDAVRLWPARPIDWSADVPGLMFPVRFRVQVSGAADFLAARTVVDRTVADEPNPGEQPREYRFAPVNARYLRLNVVQLGQRDPGHFAIALAEMEALDGDRVVSRGGRVSASGMIETNHWSRERLTDGITRSQKGQPAKRGPATTLRTEFSLDQVPPRALLFATARGVYELRINGQRVGDQRLAPEWTDYRTRVQYQTYDVTSLLRPGRNAIGAIVADGWYAGKIGLFTNQMYGDQTGLCAWLSTGNAGAPMLTTSDHWKGTLDGPIRAADILDGQTTDLRREMPAWDQPGFDDSSWKPVTILEAGAVPFVAQPNEPIRVSQEIKPVAVTEPAPAIYVVDFGQNLPGVVSLRSRGTPGTEVTVRHGEALDDSGRLYTANLRGAAQTDRFILSGGDDALEPRFTYHGFRYAEITGLPSRPTDIVARVFHSDPPEAGSFECSSPMLNRLMSNIRWTQYANMMSVPTDCPQRDERLGWMGDAHIFAQTAIYNLDMAAFFSKWCRDIRDAQAPDGRYSDVSPNPVLASGQLTSVPGWGDAGVSTPWHLYENYADTRVLAEHYDSARRWIEYIRSKNPNLIWEHARGNDYGDWLNGDTLRLEGFPSKGAEVPKEIFATVCFEHSTRQVSQMAAALKKADDADAYRDLADRIRAAFRERFIAPDGKMPGDTQAGYALALHFGLAPDGLRPAMVSHLLAAIERYKGRLSTGFHSTVPMMEALIASDHADVAYRLLNSTEFPGWGFMIEQGATSMWERWDGYVKGRSGGGGAGGFQDPGMNSFNHFAFGAIGEWMFRHIGGIQADPASPGWSHFIIAPTPGGGLTWAKTRYRSIHGDIATSWRLDGDRLTLDVTIPANTTATILFPVRDAASIRESDHPAANVEGVALGGPVGDALRIEVQAGSYRFTGTRGR